MGKAISAVIAVVVLALAGLGYYAYRQPADDQDAEVIVATDMSASTTAPGFVVATTTPAVPNAGVDAAPAPAAQSKPAPKPAPRQSASAYSATYTSANSYHNGTYGLTVPGSYTVTQSQGVYGGVPTTTTLNFYRNGMLAFSINVWSREMWSKLRNQETWNADAGNLSGTYYGEGTYLGENFTWIYSILPQGGAVPAGIVFY